MRGRGILLALGTGIPVSVFVTSLSFATYLTARFLVGPRIIGGDARRDTATVG
jgi:hypothetical protein